MNKFFLIKTKRLPIDKSISFQSFMEDSQRNIKGTIDIPLRAPLTVLSLDLYTLVENYFQS